MFLTFGYLVVELYNWYRNLDTDMRYLKLLKTHLNKGSVLVRNSQRSSQTSKDCQNISALVKLSECNILQTKAIAKEKRKEILSVAPKLRLELAEWTAYLDQQNYCAEEQGEENTSCYVLFETDHTDNEDDFLERSLSIPRDRQVKVVECTRPLAWKSGSPFGIIAECSVNNLSKLTAAFMDGRLILDDMLELSQMITVDIEGQAVKLLRASGSPSPYSVTPFGSNAAGLNGSNLPPPPAFQSTPMPEASGVHLDIPQATASNLKAIPDILNVELDSYADSNESLADFDAGFQDQDAFLASKSRLRDQTEGVGDSGDMMSDELMESTAGEALSPPIAELAPETLTPVRRAHTTNSKPPNILVYTGKKDSTRQFEAVKPALEHCLNCDRYAIYQLKHEHIHTTPWAQNTALLVVCSEKAYDGADEQFVRYFQDGGTVVFFGCAADGLFVDKKQTGTSPRIQPLTYKDHTGVPVISTRYEFTSVDSFLPDVQIRVLAYQTGSDTPLILEANHDVSSGVAVLSQVNLDADPMEMAISPDIFAQLKQANPARFEILKDLLISLGLDCTQAGAAALTPAVLLSVQQEHCDKLLDSIKPRLDNKCQLRSRNLKLHIVSDINYIKQPVSADVMPILVNHEANKCTHQFNWREYKDNLHTKVLGQTVIYADVMTSTMQAFDGIMLSTPRDVGVAAVAGRQTGGKGRGGNVWLSPVGCALCSVHVRLSMQSNLGQRPAFVQHIAGMAVVEALASLEGFKNINVRLKWPNDIWFGNKMKLGGVLVQSTILRQTLHANIGIGFNVSNKDPTICINDLIEQHNKQHSTNLGHVTTEQMIARMITCLEMLIDEFQEQGPGVFLHRYYEKWLHKDSVVKVERDDNVTVKILGLDDHGYLLAEKSDGSQISLQDDGNSFDMMANLIRIKTS